MKGTSNSQAAIVGWGVYASDKDDAGSAIILSYVPNRTRDVGSFTPIGSRLSGNIPGDRFGESIALSEDSTVVVVGASGGEYARVFQAQIR